MTIIIGAGISGLSLAWHLEKLGKPYLLLESGNTTGGYIKTITDGPYQLELGPNSLLLDTETELFLKSLGLDNEILPANEVSKNRFIYRNGAYRALPASPPALLFSGFFSLSARILILAEFFNHSKGNEHETLSDFFERRFGSEIVNYALDPFVTGIYAGDVRKLLVSETFPQLPEMERKYGSVLKGFIKSAGATRRKSVNFKQGMQTLTNTLGSQIGNIKFGQTVETIEKNRAGFKVYTQGGPGNSVWEAEKVVLALPAFAAWEPLAKSFPKFSEAAKNIHYPPMVAIHTAFKKPDVAHKLNGFGGLNPGIENRFAAGSIWTSSVFQGRCPTDEVLLTTFVGGVKNAAHTNASDDVILEKTVRELTEAYSITGEPVYTRLTRWPRAIPQYDANLKIMNKETEAAMAENLFVCSNWQGGISLPDCMRKAKQLANIL